MKKIPLGIDDYKTLFKDCYYVDKTGFISEILKNANNTVLLFTRPRRFGKTLALSMIDTFFDNKIKNNKDYFIGTQITQNNEAIKEMGEYPVVFLTFKDCHAASYSQLLAYIHQQIAFEYYRHNEILESKNTSEIEKMYYKNFIDNTLNISDTLSSIYMLCKMLSTCYQKQTILLIDEYDTPIQSAYDNNYFDEAIESIKRLYGMALKGNEYIKYAICSGITRIGKESIFSGLNNVIVNSVIDNEYGEFFGFTEKEVKDLLSFYGGLDHFDTIKKHYNGYRFGKNEVFNPRSTLYCIRNSYRFNDYWANTSSDDYIQHLLNKYDDLKTIVIKLLNDDRILVNLEDNFTYSNETRDNIISLLVSAGYLTSIESEVHGFWYVYLPNIECKNIFAKTSLSLYSSESYKELFKLKEALLSNKPDILEQYLNNNLLKTLSYYDFSNEKNYQIMLLTLSSLLFSKYYVKSEVIAGIGRMDILILSKTFDNSLVIEIKQVKAKVSLSNLKQYAVAAVKQIKEKDYALNLIKTYKNVLAYGVAFYKNYSQVYSEKLK